MISDVEVALRWLLNDAGGGELPIVPRVADALMS